MQAEDNETLEGQQVGEGKDESTLDLTESLCSWKIEVAFPAGTEHPTAYYRYETQSTPTVMGSHVSLTNEEMVDQVVNDLQLELGSEGVPVSHNVSEGLYEVEVQCCDFPISQGKANARCDTRNRISDFGIQTLHRTAAVLRTLPRTSSTIGATATRRHDCRPSQSS